MEAKEIGMTKLHISDSLLLSRDTVTSTLVVYGGKGMGKTNLAAVIMEEMSKLGLRWAVLDPVGVWWGLRHSRDGKGPGVECLILGGSHGDIPIEPTGGAVVADLVADEAVNVIIDFSRKPNGESWGIGERIRFVTDYGRRLFQRQSSLVDGRRREPLFQMVDEAARFMPQIIRTGQPELAMCLSVWSQIVEEGRNAGLGVGLVTQRSARLNKDVAELADAMIAFRTVGPNSVNAVMDWVGEHIPKDRTKELIGKLRSLPRGSGLVVSPGWLEFEDIVHFRERETFDSSATPKPGESAKRVTGQAAKPDLAKYAARMQETIERQKQEDPAVLKAKIRELDRDRLEALRSLQELRGTTQAPVDARDIEKAVAAALEEQQQRFNQHIRQVKGYLDSKGYAVQEIVERLSSVRDDVAKLVFTWPDKAPEFGGSRVVVDSRMPPGTVEFRTPNRSVTVTNCKIVDGSSNGDVKVKAGARRMLAACATWHGKWISESQVAAQAGVKRTSGTFSQYKAILASNKLVSIQNGMWQITDPGMRLLGASAPDIPRSTQEVLAVWMPKFKAGARRMLEIIVERRGRSLTVEELGQRAGISHESGTFGQYLGHLVTAELVVKPERGYVAANKEVLFL